MAAKAGLLAKLLLLLKASVVLVKFTFARSMAVSVIAYAFIFGWWYAVGFVALIAGQRARWSGSRHARCPGRVRAFAHLPLAAAASVGLHTGFFLNLFNLVPALPLDGGRVAGALHPALWIVGLVAAGVFAILHPHPVLIFILVLGTFELVRRWRTHKWLTDRQAVSVTENDPVATCAA